MYRISQKVVLAFTLAAGVSMLGAATRSIGVATSDGNIFINDAKTAGNATIFDGNTLQTQTGVSRVLLNDGAQVRFAAESRGKIFADHVDMEKGSARISGFAATANGLSIRADVSTTATVSMLPGKTVEVAALTGNVHVFNAEGINVANLLPGRALNLKPQDAGAAAPSSLTGCAVSVSGTLLLTDETSNVTVQLRGGNVRAGRRVQVTGSTVANATATKPATQVINVTGVKQVGGACKAGTAAAAAGAGAAGAGAAAGAGGAAAGAAGGAAGAAGAAAGAAAAGISTTTAVVAGVTAATAGAVAGGISATGGSPSSSQVGGSGAVQTSGTGSAAASR